MNPTVVIRPLPAELQEIANKELNEVPSRVAEDVISLRTWILKQSHLRARTDDQFLIAFLRGAKFSLEKAKQKIDRFYTLKAVIPEVFNDRRLVDDPIVREIIRLGIILQIPLPNGATGPCITIIRVGAYDTGKFKFADIIRVGSMFAEILMLENDNSTVSGVVEIMDMDKVTGSHFFQLQPDIIKRFSVFADEAMPVRQRGTHFINVPGPFEMGFNTLKTFFSEKSKSRITVSSDPDAIYNYVPRSQLPIEYGGELGCMQDIINRMECKIFKYREHFQNERNYGTDEKLRDDNLIKSNQNRFGVEGSFRRLDID